MVTTSSIEQHTIKQQHISTTTTTTTTSPLVAIKVSLYNHIKKLQCIAFERSCLQSPQQIVKVIRKLHVIFLQHQTTSLTTTASRNEHHTRRATKLHPLTFKLIAYLSIQLLSSALKKIIITVKLVNHSLLITNFAGKKKMIDARKPMPTDRGGKIQLLRIGAAALVLAASFVCLPASEFVYQVHLSSSRLWLPSPKTTWRRLQKLGSCYLIWMIPCFTLEMSSELPMPGV
jgi:hypothetical protein